VKVLLVADLHYDLRKFDWVVEAAALVDVVVLAGDHLEIAAIVDRPAQTVVVQRYFKKLQSESRLLICSGNHDLDAKNANGELTAKWLKSARYMGIPTDGDSVVIGDTLFSLCPWWDGDKGKAEIGEQLARDAVNRPARWVWVYHSPPEGSPTSWGGKRSFGDSALRAWIDQYQPDYVLSGHVHQSPFVPDGSWADRIGNSWVFNAGHQVGPIPAHVVVDLDEPRAFWLSLMGRESIDLGSAAERPYDRLLEQPEWLEAMTRLGDRRLA
jgi:Icc-related predicted phosphoesterase